jgi:hypothetical protein
MWSVHVGGTHLPAWQLVLVQSLPTVHALPFAQAGAPSVDGELEPPQSTSVSLSFFTPSLGEGASQTPALQTRLLQSVALLHPVPAPQASAPLQGPVLESPPFAPSRWEASVAEASPRGAPPSSVADPSGRMPIAFVPEQLAPLPITSAAATTHANLCQLRRSMRIPLQGSSIRQVPNLMLRQRAEEYNAEPMSATCSSVLTPTELSLLRMIREADEDHGGLFRDEVTLDDLEVCDRLVERGLAEVLSEFGEAPDGEEDERDAGGRCFFRITGYGVERLAEARYGAAPR